MWFSLFAIVLILTITFFQGLQGLFTALITCVLTVLSAALAFGLYEDVYFAFLIDRQPDYGRSIALMAIFLVSLLVLRTIFDMVITGNMQFPVYVDRAGGGLFGFVTAMTVVGMLALGFQLLPFPPSFLGFSRYTVVNSSGEAVPETEDLSVADWSSLRNERHSLWLQPESFTLALVNHLSSNALQGRARMADVRPDLLAAAHWARGNPLGPSRPVAGKDSVRVTGYWDLQPNEFFTRKHNEDKKTVQLVPQREAPAAGMKRIAVRVTLDDGAKDGDGAYRFVPEQVRLVVDDGRSENLRTFTPVGVSDEKFPDRIIQVYPGQGIGRKPEKAGQPLDFAFEVPEQLKIGPGSYLEYKMNARAELTGAHNLNEKRPPPISGKAAPKDAQQPKSGEGSISSGGTTPQTYGRLAVLGPAKEMVVSDAMPWGRPLTNYGGQAEVSGGVVKEAKHLVAELDEEGNPKEGTQPAVEKFDVPQGMRLLQVSVERLQAGSTLGRAVSFAVESLGDFYLVDDAKKQHRPVGVYAIAKTGGRNVFELIYLNETERDMARLPKFTRIKSADLQRDYVLVYLFAVPPGTKPAEVHTGRRPVDLRPFSMTVE